MQQYTIRMSKLAEQDLESAGDYIAYKLLNPTAAVNTVKGIRKTINTLQLFPECHELEKSKTWIYQTLTNGEDNNHA